MDEYHNRPLPPRDNTQYAIIPWMVDFAQIIRKVSVQIYHRRMPLVEKLHVALAIEAELDGWMASLPGWIRPEFVDGGSGEGGEAGANEGASGRNALRDPKWARRQRIVLGLRMSCPRPIWLLYRCDMLTAQATTTSKCSSSVRSSTTIRAVPKAKVKLSIRARDGD
jgi:hypothetical protein